MFTKIIPGSPVSAPIYLDSPAAMCEPLPTSQHEMFVRLMDTIRSRFIAIDGSNPSAWPSHLQQKLRAAKLRFALLETAMTGPEAGDVTLSWFEHQLEDIGSDIHAIASEAMLFI